MLLTSASTRLWIGTLTSCQGVPGEVPAALTDMPTVYILVCIADGGATKLCCNLLTESVCISCTCTSYRWNHIYPPMRFQRNHQKPHKDVVPQSPLGILLIMPAQTVNNTARSKSLIMFTLGQCDLRVPPLEAL